MFFGRLEAYTLAWNKCCIGNRHDPSERVPVNSTEAVELLQIDIRNSRFSSQNPACSSVDRLVCPHKPSGSSPEIGERLFLHLNKQNLQSPFAHGENNDIRGNDGKFVSLFHRAYYLVYYIHILTLLEKTVNPVRDPVCGHLQRYY